MMRVFLEREGFSVKGCVSGKEAVDLIDTEKFDLFIVDIMLPYLNGLEVVDHIRNNSTKNAHAKVIIVSDITNEDYVKDGFDIGADDIMRKPVSPPEFVARVHHHLKKNT